MQYFIGYSSFCKAEPFDPSLFVEFRKRLGIEQINSINEKILNLSQNRTSNFSKEEDSNPSNFNESDEGDESDRSAKTKHH